MAPGVSEFYITSHLLCWALGGGATNSPSHADLPTYGNFCKIVRFWRRSYGTMETHQILRMCPSKHGCLGTIRKLKRLSRNAFKLKIGQAISEIRPLEFGSIVIILYWWIRYFLGILSAYFWLKLTNTAWFWWKFGVAITTPKKVYNSVVFHFLYIYFHVKFCTEMGWNLTEKSYWKFRIVTEINWIWAESYWMRFSNVGRSETIVVHCKYLKYLRETNTTVFSIVSNIKQAISSH